MSEIIARDTPQVKPTGAENGRKFDLDTDGIPGDGASDGTRFPAATADPASDSTPPVAATIPGQPVPATTPKAEFNGEMLASFLEVVQAPGEVLEVRSFEADYATSGGYIIKGDRYKKTFSGWYNSAISLAGDARRFQGVSAYIIPNPTIPDMLACSANKLKAIKTATKDEHIRCLRWLYLDFDAKKPSDDMSASDAERAAALASRDAVLAQYPRLAESAIWGCSGNGGWILVRLADLPNNDENRALVAKTVDYFVAHHGADLKTKNPARLMPLVGSYKCKGSNVAGRPWRPVTLDSEAIPAVPFDLASFVAEHASLIPVEPMKSAKGKSSSVPAVASQANPGDLSEDAERIYRAARYLDSMSPAVSGQGGHDQTFDAACTLVVEFGLSKEQARPILETWNQRCSPPWTDTELDHKLNDADAKGGPRGRLFDEKPSRPVASEPAAPDAEASDRSYMMPYLEPGRGSAKWNMTDWGNAQRLVFRYGRNIRFCRDWGVWLVWTGSRWTIDRTGVVYRMARKAVLLISEETNLCTDKEEKEAMFGWMMGSENKKRMDSMIELAKKQEGITVDSGEFDTDQWLLNTRNCTIDLRTGKPREHRREDFITKEAPVDYDENALCSVWEATIDTVMNGNPSLIGFVQRAFGYSCTGMTREQCLFFLYGSGANGKSTVLGEIEEALGDYACVVRPELLTAKEQQDHPTELCDLQGKRFVSTIEVEDGKKLAEALVKSLTGGDKIRARRMRQDPFQFSPTFKLFVAANHKPIIRGTDNGIWRRIKMIPFSVTIPKEKQDLSLPDKLRAERAGILAWLVRGCLEWQRDGLRIPKEVEDATSEYRAEMDSFGDFAQTCCEIGPGCECKASDLYHAYKGWCEESGTHAWSMTKFGGELGTRGFAAERRTGGIWRLGIMPRPNPAVSWLDGYLSVGPAKASDVLGEAERLGYPKDRVFRAKDALKVETIEADGRKIWQKQTPF